MASWAIDKLRPAAVGFGDAGNVSVWEPESTERILVLAPHPDDESLAAGGVIGSIRERQSRPEIRVIIVTNGDASYATALFHGSHTFAKRHFRSIAEQRQQESLSALIILGLTSSQIQFWGFPDRGLSQLRKKYWGDQEAYRSPTTGFRQAEQALNSPSFQYNGTNLLCLLLKEFMTFSPTTVIFPHPWDVHPDHKTLALLTLFAARVRYGRQSLPQMLAYMMWAGNKFWMTGAHSNTQTKNLLPKKARHDEWRRFPLSKSDQEQKILALQCYRSQNFAAGKILRTGAEHPQELFAVYSPFHSTQRLGPEQ